MVDQAKAFAALITSRTTELGISRDEVAGQLDVMVSTVEGGLEGSSFPDDDEIERLGRVLRLPRSLLREARRRSVDEGAEPVTEPEPAPEPQPATAPPSTLEEPVPVPAPTSDSTELFPATDRREAVSRAAEAISTPWRVARDRLERRRQVDRAPTKEPSYLEDQRQVVTYRTRAALTAGGVLVLVVLLRWALGGFGDALGELWDSLTGAF